MKYLDFRPTFVEPIWMNTKQKEIALLFLKSLAYNKYNINQYLPQFHVFYVALNITAKSLINQTQISAIFTLFFFFFFSKVRGLFLKKVTFLESLLNIY